MLNTSDNSPHYSLRFTIVSIVCCLASLVGILFLQYRFLYLEAHKLLAQQAHYRRYMQNILNNEQSDDTTDSIETETPPFVTVNRDPEYLKNSMIDYLKQSNLDSALSRVNISEWHDYTGNNTHAQITTPPASVPRACSRLSAKKSSALPKIKSHKRVSTSLALFSWPIDPDQFWLSSFFGPRKRGNNVWEHHLGIDMAACRGTLVKAPADGTVLEARYASSGYGNMIVLLHDKHYTTRLAHLDQIFVTKGQKVKPGQPIGTVGATGSIRKKGKDGSHLHFEVLCYNKRINPLTVLPLLT